MMYMGWTGAEVAAMQDTIELGRAVSVLANDLFEHVERRAWTVVRGYHGDSDAFGVGDLDFILELKGDKPFLVNSQLLPNQIRGHFAGIDGTMAPRGCQTDVMVGMEMAQEVGILASDFAVSKGVDANEQSRHDLVEGTGPLICWLAS